MTAQFFAWRDPDTGEMTYWRRHETGALVPWPKGTRYGPVLWKVPGPGREHVVPNLPRREQVRWIVRWQSEHLWPWQERVHAAIEADPDAAAALFAEAKIRCWMCGRTLKDSLSRSLGIGPDCRDGIPEPLLAAVREAIRRAREAVDNSDPN